MTDDSAAPYLFHRSISDDPRTRQRSPRGTLFSRRSRAARFQVVIPYSLDVDFIHEAPRTPAIVNEVLACYGGDPAHVHLAALDTSAFFDFWTAH